MAAKENTVLWWIGWIVATIVSFFISCWFWTGFIAKNVGPMSKPGVPIIWVAAVFGTWMILLVPLIVVMYSKVDKAYEDARLSREARELERAKNDLGVRSVLIEASERALPKPLKEKLKQIPKALPRGHLVTAVLKDGRRFEHVFILDKDEVLGIYNQKSMPFKVSDIVDLLPSDLDALPVFESERWLRLDGAGMSL